MSRFLFGKTLPIVVALSTSATLLAAPTEAPAATNNLSLAAKYPPEALRKMLVPRAEWRPYARIEERGAWQRLPEAARQTLLAKGEETLAQPCPMLPATLYLEYARKGNRSRYEAVHKQRRQMLHHLVLAECLESKGRFLDAIANVAWAICEESTWCYPAHVGAQKAGVGLPDINEPIVALFSAETAVSLSWTLYLLGEKLDKISPRIRPRIEQEISRRILTPFLERDDFGWMAFYNVTRTHRPNNWNPWINASVLTAALLTEPDAERRVQIVHKALRSLDRFLVAHPADGSCDEGPGYWGHAGGSLFEALNLLHGATKDGLDVFGHPLIQEIGRFIYRAHICGDWFVPVGDCSARLSIGQDLVFRYGTRIDDAQMKALAAHGATPESILESAGDRYFGRLLSALFGMSEILESQPASPPLVRDVWLGSEDMQLMAARSEPGTCRGFYVAAWGGHNGQSHNHHDVGNFIVFADGQPALVDVGVTTYSAKTFSSRRYEIWVMQSGYHNLPSINGQMQRGSARAAARDVKYHADDAAAQLEMNLAAAYPEEAQASFWRRTVRLNRGRDVVVQDAFELNALAGPVVQHLMTPLEVQIKEPGRVVLSLPASDGQKGRSVRLEFDGSRWAASVEKIDLDDERLSKVWGPRMNRLLLRAIAPSKRGEWTLRVAFEE